MFEKGAGGDVGDNFLLFGLEGVSGRRGFLDLAFLPLRQGRRLSKPQRLDCQDLYGWSI